MKYLAAILILLSLRTLYAQGEYTEKEKNTFGIMVSTGYNPKVISLSGSAGVSNSGIVDFGIGYGYLFSRENNPYDDPTSNVIVPFAAYHFLKQSSTVPLSVSARIQYVVHRISSKDDSSQVSLGSWSAGGSVFHRFEISPKFQIQPFLAVSLVKPERWPGEPPASMVTAYEVSAAFITNFEPAKVILRPAVSYSQGDTVYLLNFEFVDLL